MGTEGTTGAIVADADEDELLEDGRAPPPPLVKVPTEATEAERADATEVTQNCGITEP